MNEKISLIMLVISIGTLALTVFENTTHFISNQINELIKVAKKQNEVNAKMKNKLDALICNSVPSCLHQTKEFKVNEDDERLNEIGKEFEQIFKTLNEVSEMQKDFKKRTDLELKKCDKERIKRKCDNCANRIRALNKSSNKSGLMPKDGLTDQERIVMSHLIDSWNEFNKLETTHPDAKNDFADGIHKCQEQLIHRIVQRDYPQSYPKKYKRL